MPVPLASRDPKAWNTVILGVFVLPGVVQDISVKEAEKVDVKNKPGSNGATITYQGHQPAKIEITLLLTDADLDDWYMVYGYIRPHTKKKEPTHFQIYHPVTDIYRIGHVCLEETSFATKGKQLYELKLSLIEYLKAKNAGVTTPKTSTKSTKVPTVVDDKQSYRNNPDLVGPPPPTLDKANVNP